MNKYLKIGLVGAVVLLAVLLYPKQSLVGGTKISNLTSYSAAISTDLIPIVDVTAVQTKQITVANLFNRTATMGALSVTSLTSSGFLSGTFASLSLNIEATGYASASNFFHIPTQMPLTFSVINIPTTRAGAASSSTGYEYTNQIVPTAANTFAVATTSADFAVTMSGSGMIKGCSVKYDTLSTTGAVSIMVTKNGTLLTPGTSLGKYCKVANFATGGNVKNSATQSIADNEITFVAGDRFGMIASSTGLSAATMDGWATIVFQLANP